MTTKTISQSTTTDYGIQYTSYDLNEAFLLKSDFLDPEFGNGNVNLITDTQMRPASGSDTYDTVYDVAQPGANGNYMIYSGANSVFLYGNDDAHIYFDPTQVGLIAGNNGNDTFNFRTSALGSQGSANPTFFLGSGNNTLNLNSTTANFYTIIEGSGSNTNTYNVSGNAYLAFVNIASSSSSAGLIVNVAVNTVLTLNRFLYGNIDARINLAGNDTLNAVNLGNDTVIAHGSATVMGGAGTLLFSQSQHATGGDTVYAGSGNTTLHGGAQASTFFGSTSAAVTVQMYAGTAGDTLVGGSGYGVEGMHGGAGVDHFEFDQANGGAHPDSNHPGSNFAHVIYGFTEGQDLIDLKGYTASDVHLSVTSGGDTILKLTDGTIIKLMGDSHFNPVVDIKFH